VGPSIVQDDPNIGGSVVVTTQSRGDVEGSQTNRLGAKAVKRRMAVRTRVRTVPIVIMVKLIGLCRRVVSQVCRKRY
jgi:hypothetical protein